VAGFARVERQATAPDRHVRARRGDTAWEWSSKRVCRLRMIARLCICCAVYGISSPT
jgi:hypothetical protein